MKASIQQYVVDTLLDGKPVSCDEDLLLSGLVDSLGVMRLVNYLEDTYAINVSPEDVTIDHFDCIDSIAAYVSARLEQ